MHSMHLLNCIEYNLELYLLLTLKSQTSEEYVFGTQQSFNYKRKKIQTGHSCSLFKCSSSDTFLMRLAILLFLPAGKYFLLLSILITIKVACPGFPSAQHAREL